MRVPLVTLFAILLTGCFREEPWVVVWVLSPPGETFTVGTYNELGAGGGRVGSVLGTGSFEEISYKGGDLDPSIQEIRGSFTGAYLVVGFGTTRNGGWGAESGSLQSLSGPNPQVSPCSVRYEASEAGGSIYSAQFRFTAVPTDVCREP